MKFIPQWAKNSVRGALSSSMNLHYGAVTGRSFHLTADEWLQAKVSFSQYGEDLLVLDLLRKRSVVEKGFYVDVGAFDPVRFSNTNLLYQLGWRGINIDTSSEAIERFQRLRSRDINLLYGVASSESEMEVCTYSDACTNSMFAVGASDKRSLIGEQPRSVSLIKTRSLSAILKEHLPYGGAVDFLDIDCEGLDLDVLQSVDWNTCQPYIVAVEDFGSSERSPISEFCTRIGYRLVATLFYTRIYVRDVAEGDSLNRTRR